MARADMENDLLGLLVLPLLLMVLAFPVLALVAFLRGNRLRSDIDSLALRMRTLEKRLDGRAVPAPRAEALAPPIQPPVAPRPIEEPPVTTVPALEPALPASMPPRADDLDLEARIGGRWLQNAGLIVLVLGVAFFLRYAFDHNWLAPPVRVALGVMAGIGMAVGGGRLSRTYRVYGLMLCGGGIAVLYLSIYAGLSLYDLFEPATAFGLLVVTTAAAAVLADRTDSSGLALMAVCGGFATPFLVGGRTDQQMTLFSYVALLVAATMYLAHRREWPWLNAVSLALTVLTVLAWADAYYTPNKYLRTELFLTVYCVMFLDMLRKAWHMDTGNNVPLIVLLMLAPAGYHLWSVIALSPHGIALLVYLISVTLVTVLAGVRLESSVLRLVGWCAVALPLGSWIGAHHSREWLLATIASVAGICIVHLAAQVREVSHGDDLDSHDVFLLHANGIGVFAALYEVLIDTATIAQIALLAVVLAATNVAIWAVVRRAAPLTALHWLGVAITLVAVAIWIQLGGPWAVATWATEGAVVFWIAARAEREWLRVGAWVLLAMAIYRWLLPDIQETTTAWAPIANARALTGLYLVALLYVAAGIQRRDVRAAAEHAAIERAALIVGASIVTVWVISTEIISFWDVRVRSSEASLAREFMLSAAWVAYAALAVVVGMRRRYAPVRYFAIALLGVALVKIFTVDLETIGGIYRVAGFLVVGLILLVVSFLYQRANVAARVQPSNEPPAA